MSSETLLHFGFINGSNINTHEYNHNTILLYNHK